MLCLYPHYSTSTQIDLSHRVNLIAYGGQTIQTLGTATLVLSRGKLHFHIVDRHVKSLLGLPDSMKLNLIQLSPEVYAAYNNRLPR